MVENIKTKVLSFLPIDGLEEKVLIKGASSSFIIKIAGAALAFGVNILLARLLGVQNYGAYIYIYTWVTIIALPIRMGFDNGLVRFIPEYKSAKKWSDLKGFLSFTYKSVAVVGLCVAAIAATVVLLFNDITGNYSQILIILGAAILPVLGLLKVTTSSLKGLKKVVRALIPSMIIKQLLIALGAVLIYLLYEKVSAVDAMGVTLFAIGASLVVGLFFLKDKLPGQLNSQPSSRRYKYWLRVTLPMLFISGMTLILGRADLIMIGILKGNELTGIYGAVIKISTLVLFVSQAINTIAAPLISELYHKREYVKLQRIVTLSARFSFGLSLIIAVGFVLFGSFILRLFGPEFTSGYIALIVLLIAFLLSSFMGFVATLLNMTNHQNIAAIIYATGAIINIVLNLIFIPIWGIAGAAMATGISLIIYKGIMIAYVYRKLKINPTVILR